MSRAISLTLTEPQRDFVMSTARHPGLVAGYGSGKSQAAVMRILILALKYPGLPFAFVEPTFDLVRLIAWPRFSEILDAWGVGYRLNKAESMLYLENGSQVIFRSADNPERMVGFEVADAVIDEADVLSMTKAQDVWIKMLGRARKRKPDNSPNTVGCVSTPEGFKWMHKAYVRDARPGYELIRASTYSNPYLPDGYIDQIRSSYPPQLIEAYLEGNFVNLTSGSVYPDFDRRLNHTSETMRPGEVLHVGMDFNVQNLHATVNVIRDGRPLTVAEVTKVRDTPTVARLLRERFPQRTIIVYPDAAGSATSTKNASESDHAILRAAQFQIEVRGVNPAVKDRINAVNAMICNAEGERKWLINTDACPVLTECLEQQAYDNNGEPDKKSGFDHANDAQGYFLANRFPILTRQAQRIQVVGR